MTTIVSRKILLAGAMIVLCGVPFAVQAATLSVSPTTASPNTNTNVTVSWTGATLAADWVGFYAVGADNYSYLGYFYTSSCGASPGSRGATAAGNCSFTVNQPTGFYEFRFLPNDGWTSTAVSQTITVGTPDTTAPTVPTGLNGTVVSSSQINLSWTASTDAVGVTGYKIYRDGVQIGTSAGTSYSSTGLSPSTSYTYTVSAYDAAGNNSAQSSSIVRTTSAAATTWAAPTSNAPSGNVTPALSTSTVAQDKTGILGITGTTTVLGNTLVSASTYLNWGTTAGSSGYGLRDVGGVLQVKSTAGGTWGNIQSTVQQIISTASAWIAGPSNSINYTAGNVGIGTTTPTAKLDVQGYARLTPQTAAPAACGASRKGALAVSNFGSRLCICNGTSWVFNYNGSACVWAGTSGTQPYDGAGTYQFTVPAYAGSLTVQVWGAGGGASGGNYYHNYSAGGNGGTSSFAGLSATGGTGGVAASNQGPYWIYYYPAVGGPGGAGSGGTTNLNGSAGQGDEGAGGGASPNGGGASIAGAWGNWPGGGGAGGYSGSAGGAGGGGGGGYTSKTYMPGELSIGSQITVTVGAGGAGASAGCCTGGTGASGRVLITWN